MYSRKPGVCVTSTARRSIGDQPPKSVLYDIIGSSSLTEFFPNASTHYTMAGGQKIRSLFGHLWVETNVPLFEIGSFFVIRSNVEKLEI